MVLSLPESLRPSAQASCSEDMHTLALVVCKLRSDVVLYLALEAHFYSVDESTLRFANQRNIIRPTVSGRVQCSR